MEKRNVGTVVQVVGPVLDIRFNEKELPELLNAIELEIEGRRVIAEVEQHIGGGIVRCVSMSSTDGLVRGTRVVDTGAPIMVPVGEDCLGRIFNLLGEPLDELPFSQEAEKRPIHHPAPSYEEQESTTEILETGIKVIALLEPYSKGGKIFCQDET